MRRPLNLRSILSPGKALLAAECVAALLLARIGLKVARLPALSTMGCRIFSSLGIPAPPELCDDTARQVAAWVHRASEFVPLMLCLPQALATQWLIARRGGTSTLHVGVVAGEGALRSHAWLTYKGNVLIGGAMAPRVYREILRSESPSLPSNRNLVGTKVQNTRQSS